VKRELRREREIWAEDREAAMVPPRVGVTMRSHSRSAAVPTMSSPPRESTSGSGVEPGVGPWSTQPPSQTTTGSHQIEKHENLTARQVLPSQEFDPSAVDISNEKEARRGRDGAGGDSSAK
jgi:hypothetical protein